MGSPRGLIALLAGAVLGATGAPAPATTPTVTTAAPGPTYTFISAPDFLNVDVADLSGQPLWDGIHNSFSAPWALGLSTVLSTFAALHPDDVLVAGDLVGGYWGMDSLDTGNFGPVDTREHRLQALTRAADRYLSVWRQRFVSYDLHVLPAIGDHDIGDNNWKPSSWWYSSFRQRNLELFKQAFWRNVIAPLGVARRPLGPASHTAYATYVDPEVLVVSVDEFLKTSNDVQLRIDEQQLRWLERVLDDAQARGTDWIIVQGHLPVIGPVRAFGSSDLMYLGGSGSPFWRTLVRHHVDLYLCGEVHEVTARRLQGVTQISHGAAFNTDTKYLTGKVFGNRLGLISSAFAVTADPAGAIWQTNTRRNPPVARVYGAPFVTGSMVLTSDNRVRSRAGLLAPYVPDAPR